MYSAKAIILAIVILSFVGSAQRKKRIEVEESFDYKPLGTDDLYSELME